MEQIEGPSSSVHVKSWFGGRELPPGSIFVYLVGIYHDGTNLSKIIQSASKVSVVKHDVIAHGSKRELVFSKVCSFATERAIGAPIVIMDSSHKQVKATGGKFLVGAIDFGTTYSGWAYSFLHDYKSDPIKAIVRHWYSGTDTLASEKTPTCALIAPDGKTLVAFGYEAENKYQKFVENGTHRQYYFFRRFKMALDKQTISRDLLIKDEMGKSLSAKTVFSLSIGYLADNMISSGGDTIDGEISKADVDWMLTVPAIWSDAAKQFMREAAEEAGLQKDKLTIALEPEAASIFVRHLPVSSKKGSLEISTMPAGTQYIVLDAGGGTIDITIHEINPGGGLREVHAANGGGWGGILVDNAFKDLVIELVGPHVYEEFIKTETEDWIYLWRTFEMKKKTITPENDDTINMRFPISLPSLYKEKTGHDLNEDIKRSKYANEIQLRRDKIFISSRIMKGLFDKSIQTTVSHLKTVLQESDTDKIKAILMVGGFSECHILQVAIKTEFNHLRVIIPPTPSGIVLRGSVMFGHDPLSIKQRVLKKTYGTRITHFYDATKHPEDKKEVYIYDEKYSIVNVFYLNVQKGETIVVGENQPEQSFVPLMASARSVNITFYASDLERPMYIDDTCTKIGEINIDLSDIPDDEKEMLISLNFSDTEIKAIGRVKKTGKATNVKLNFLG